MTESATEVDQLRKKRGGHQGEVSHLINEALEGERNEKAITCLKMISDKLEGKMHIVKSPVVTDTSKGEYNRG